MTHSRRAVYSRVSCAFLWWAVTLQWKAIGVLVIDTVSLAELNPERRGRTLKGIYLLLLSFFLQSAGTMVALLDDFGIFHN